MNKLDHWYGEDNIGRKQPDADTNKSTTNDIDGVMKTDDNSKK